MNHPGEDQLAKALLSLDRMCQRVFEATEVPTNKGDATWQLIHEHFKEFSRRLNASISEGLELKIAYEVTLWRSEISATLLFSRVGQNKLTILAESLQDLDPRIRSLASVLNSRGLSRTEAEAMSSDPWLDIALEFKAQYPKATRRQIAGEIFRQLDGTEQQKRLNEFRHSTEYSGKTYDSQRGAAIAKIKRQLDRRMKKEDYP